MEHWWVYGWVDEGEGFSLVLYLPSDVPKTTTDLVTHHEDSAYSDSHVDESLQKKVQCIMGKGTWGEVWRKLGAYFQ